MSVTRLTTFVLLGVVATSPLSAQQQTGAAAPAASSARALPADAEILSIIKQRVDDKRSAGIVIGVLDANGRTRVVAYGDPGPGQVRNNVATG